MSMILGLLPNTVKETGMALCFLVYSALCIKTDCYGQDTAGSEIAVVKLREYVIVSKLGARLDKQAPSRYCKGFYLRRSKLEGA